MTTNQTIRAHPDRDADLLKVYDLQHFIGRLLEAWPNPVDVFIDRVVYAGEISLQLAIDLQDRGFVVIEAIEKCAGGGNALRDVVLTHKGLRAAMELRHGR